MGIRIKYHSFFTFLSKNAFCLAGLRRLVVLDLSSNHISRLDEGLLDDFTALQVLHLGNNQIHTIATQSFINLANLHSLYLMHNRLETLQRQTLTGLSLLSILNLDNNRYEMLIHQHLKPSTWLLILFFFVSSFRLHTLHRSSLKNCTNLEFLGLSQNFLTQVPEAIMKSNLEFLDLSSNLLGVLKRESLQSLPKLKTLLLGKWENIIFHFKCFTNLANCNKCFRQ